MITRWDISAPYHGEIYEDESEQGEWVTYKDHLTVVEGLEYDLRYERECTEEQKIETEFWIDKYNELYEQQQL